MPFGKELPVLFPGVKSLIHTYARFFLGAGFLEELTCSRNGLSRLHVFYAYLNKADDYSLAMGDPSYAFCR